MRRRADVLPPFSFELSAHHVTPFEEGYISNLRDNHSQGNIGFARLNSPIILRPLEQFRVPITRRIYVSLPADPWLPQNLNELKWSIVEEVEKLG